MTLKKQRYGSVSFGNDNSMRIIEKGIVNLKSKDTTKKKLFVEEMKHILLSVIQMCDQGHALVFDSKKCKIRKEESSKLVTTTVRTLSNIYVLNEIGKEICFLRKDDESWLLHRRMRHINFDNIFKFIKNEAVREILKMSKPTNILCKHSLQGKQTKTKFNSKSYFTTKPLEIVHTDLVGKKE
jgi:hypothetical protein